MLRNFKFDSEDGVYRGTLVSPDGGRQISAKLTLIDNETLEIQGKVLLFTKTFTAKRRP